MRASRSYLIAPRPRLARRLLQKTADAGVIAFDFDQCEVLWELG
jgi:hypothetical protein